jgi:beta-lactamase class A
MRSATLLLSMLLALAAGRADHAGSQVEQPATLSGRFADIAAMSGGRFGVFAQVIESGDSAGLNDTERFPMQSVYKLPIAMAILDQVDRRSFTLNEKVSLSASDMVPGLHSPMRDRRPRGGIDVSVRELIRAAIVDSDGTASDVLLRLAGGGPRVTAYLRGLGIRDMAVVTTEREMSRDSMAQYKNYSTPRAAVDVLKALHAGRGLSPEARTLLLQDLADSTPGPRRIKALLPPGTTVAHKTGTDGTRDGKTGATNDIGLVTLPGGRHLAIAVFVKDSTADLVPREAAIAAAAKAAWDHWTAHR